MQLPQVVYTERFRLWLHIGQICLLVLASILTIIRLSTKGVVPSRAQVMIIVFVSLLPRLQTTTPKPSTSTPATSSQVLLATETNSCAISKAVKSILFITYQLLTQHSPRFIRFASLKANFVLNAIDVLFWFTAFILTCMGINVGAVAVGVILLFVVMTIM